MKCKVYIKWSIDKLKLQKTVKVVRADLEKLKS